MSRLRFYSLITLLSTLSFNAVAGFIDVDDTMAGDQTVSWDPSKVIMIFIPPQMMGTDRNLFQMGIEDFVSMFDLQVEFKIGEPPASSNQYVDVNIAQVLGGELGQGGPFVSPFPANVNHMIVDSGIINIDPSALGMAGTMLMKNLGAHEFGHVLGLDDDNRNGGNRVNVMDPDFDKDDPYLMLSARDKMMMAEHYDESRKGLPNVSTIFLYLIALVPLILFRMFKKRI